MKKIFLLFVALMLLCFTGSALAYLQPGSVAPDFEIAGLDGQTVRLSDFKGRIIVLQLGTTWCPDCVGLSADLVKIGPFLKDRDVVLVDVFIQENRRSVSKFLQGKKFAMQMVPLLDNGQAHRAYQVYLIPRLLIIDQQFRIVHDGLRLSNDALQEKITALDPPLEQKAASPPEKNTLCPPAQ